MNELVGREIESRYRIDDFIAAGGMGAVYRGTQLSVDRTVAIKVIKDGSSDEDVAVQRFFREAQSISKLQHPNIVGLVDFGTEEELIYLVMEYVDGFSLASLMEGQYSNPAFVVEAMRQITSALAEAHNRELVHRDLKPDNLLVVRLASGHLQVKVVDFGIARIARFETLSDSGTVIGTPHYMSPEQAQDSPIDGRADLFSLGVIAYEMITGTRPFDAPEPLQVMLKICRNPLPPIREQVHDLAMWPDELFTIVERLLEKSPEARIPDAATLLDRLERLQREHRLEVPRVTGDQTVREVAGPVMSTHETAPAGAVDVTAETTGSPIVTIDDDGDLAVKSTIPTAVIGLIVVAVLSAIGLGAWTLMSEDPQADPVQLAEPTTVEVEPAPEPEPQVVAEAEPQIEPAVEATEPEPVVVEEPAEAPQPKSRPAIKRPIEAKKPTPTPVPVDAKSADPLEEKLDWVKSRPRGE